MKSDAGIVSRFWGGLVGGGTEPPYRQTTCAVPNPTVLPRRPWWLACSATPQYKTRAMPSRDDCESDPGIPICPDEDPGSGGVDFSAGEPAEILVW